MNPDLKKLIEETENIVFFGGAGVSTESNIPDFRSQDGLYNQKYDEPPETILSHDFFNRRPQDFYAFYRDKMLYPAAKPNRAHLKLAELERSGKLKAVITQNIDGLHQAAGSKNVLELHGSVLRNRCLKCGSPYRLEVVLHSEGIPRCSCGGIIKPEVTLYGEALPAGVFEQAALYVQNAQMLIVGGTSLSVYPAAGLVRYYRGKKLVLINKTPTPLDEQCLVFYGSIGDILGD